MWEAIAGSLPYSLRHLHLTLDYGPNPQHDSTTCSPMHWMIWAKWKMTAPRLAPLLTITINLKVGMRSRFKGRKDDRIFDSAELFQQEAVSVWDSTKIRPQVVVTVLRYPL